MENPGDFRDTFTRGCTWEPDMSEHSSHPPVHELLAHAAWLRRLAGRLVDDRAALEDLVQDTWVSALRGPWPRGGGLRPWLARVMRNTLFQRSRRERARLAREARVEIPAETPGAGTVVERTQNQQLLVDAVLSLDEPLRSTVLLRYFDGLSSAAIARRLGVPASTVRNRLSKALAELRDRLARQRSDWLGAMTLLARTPAAGKISFYLSTLLMSTQVKLAVGVVLAAALVATFWLDGEPTLHLDDELVPGSVVEQLDEGTSTGTDDDAADGRTALEVGGTEVAGAVSEDRLTVLILDDRSRAPLPGALLHWAGDVELSRAQKALPVLDDSAVEKLLHRVDHSLIADARGVASVPRSTRLLCARLGEAFGFLRLDDGDRETAELLLSTDADLRIEVVDAEGAPCANLQVGIEAFGRRDGSWRAIGFWHGRTAARDGSATLEHWPAHLTHWRPIENLIVRLDHPGSTGEGRPITPAELDTGLVRLLMPVTGNLEFVLPPDVDPSSVGKIELHGLDTRGEHFSSWVPGPYSRRNLLEDVALGLIFSVEARSGYECVARAEGTRGPQRAGEIVSVQLQAGSLVPVMVGRLVDSSGEPLPGIELEDCFEYHLGDRRFGYSGVIETDAAGRFRSSLAHHKAFYSGWFILLDVDRGRQARVEIPVGLRPGEHALGDVVLAPPPILVRGVVVDAEGNGVARAGVRAWPADGSPPMSWAPRVFTDSAGRFLLRSPLPQEDFLLKASTHRSRASSPVLAPGGPDVVLRIEEEGAISLQLLTDDERLRRALRVSARLDGDVGHWWPKEDVAEDGPLLVEHLQPGTWRLRIELEGHREPVFEARGIQVVAGEVTQDTRLLNIDLRGRFIPLEIEVLGAEGRPLVEGVLSFRHRGESEPRNVSFEHGQATLFATRLPITVVASAPGYRRSVLEGVKSSSVLRLDRGLEVQLALPSEVVLPPPPTFLEIELQHVAGDTSAGPWPGGASDVVRGRFLSHDLALRIGAPGHYVVRWRLIEVGDFDPRGVSLDSAGEVQLRFDTGERSARLLPVDRLRLQRAMSEMMGR